MTTQEQAFRVYYGSMADAELLRTAVHKESYIALAQKLMAEEIDKRHLAMPSCDSSTPRTPSSGVFAKWIHGRIRLNKRSV